MSTASQGRYTEHRVAVLAIDPGNVESGWCVIDETRRPVKFGKDRNDDLLARLREFILFDADQIALEMVASYGMAVGKDVFETCVWIGRFQQQALRIADDVPVDLIYRRDVKLHHCHSAKAKDSNIRQALVDRFAPGQPNHGKGTKAEPGWFYGFRADVWQAYALAVYVADTQTAQNGHHKPADGLAGSPEGEGLSTTTTTPQIANPLDSTERNTA